MSLVDRGDIFDADIPGLGVRPVVVITRQVAIPVLSAVGVAMITSTVRGIASEVPLCSEHGLEHACVANCDNLFTLAKARLGKRRGFLPLEDLDRLDKALRFALQLD
ncbi:MAG TPA: type II toxin-antitoxin system PemK/MazF family toxin [Solirubrobacterales bacterium]